MSRRNTREILYGRRTVGEIMKCRPVITRLLVASGIHKSTVEDILRSARKRNIPVEEVSRKDMSHVCETTSHQGVAIEAEVRPFLDFRLFQARLAEDSTVPLVLLLDGVTDPRNLGAILRTAEAATVDAVIIPRRRSSSLTPVVHKVASGACEYLTLVLSGSPAATIELLKKAGLWIIGLDPGGKKLHTEEDYTVPSVLVLGSEGKGLSALVRKRCDILVKLPMLGRVASLNVSVAAGVILYETVRQKMLIRK